MRARSSSPEDDGARLVGRRRRRVVHDDDEVQAPALPPEQVAPAPPPAWPVVHGPAAPMAELPAGAVAEEPAAPGAEAPAVAAEVAAAALLWESQLPVLADGARRRHMHYTHVRTFNPHDTQPNELTREQFWNHLTKCYLEAYPLPSSPTGTILQFGIVVKELHHQDPSEIMRDEHHHAATMSSTQHYWRRVKAISAKYHVQLNAVAHDHYSTMYEYVTVASQKKPGAEIDSRPFLSPLHPVGDALEAVLQQGHRLREARAAQAGDEGDPALRSQYATVFNWVVDHHLRGAAGAIQLQADAVEQVGLGDPRLLEFVKRHPQDLEDQVAFCWVLHDAPNRLKRLDIPRAELLLTAATEPLARCRNGELKCATLYEGILLRQGVGTFGFRHHVFRALTAGRQKGNALMIVGPGDSGKTTVTSPAAEIFKAMPTPQSDTFCPLERIRGHELLLWQDLRYNPGHPDKDTRGLRVDEGTMNRLMEGQPTLIGVPKSLGASDFVYTEDVAMIFTGPRRFQAYRDREPDAIETAQLTSRMKYVEFTQSIESEERVRGRKPCGPCWARWVLHGEIGWQENQGVDLSQWLVGAMERLWDSPADMNAYTHTLEPAVPAGVPIQQGPPESLWEKLQTLMRWQAEGRLTDREFANAKRLLGL